LWKGAGHNHKDDYNGTLRTHDELGVGVPGGGNPLTKLVSCSGGSRNESNARRKNVEREKKKVLKGGSGKTKEKVSVVQLNKETKRKRGSRAVKTSPEARTSLRKKRGSNVRIGLKERKPLRKRPKSWEWPGSLGKWAKATHRVKCKPRYTRPGRGENSGRKFSLGGPGDPISKIASG